VDISVIIVNWNTKKLLLDCIKSLLSNKSRYETEIIVVDNASSDGSPEAVKEQFPNIKLICNNKNLGFAKANNIGLEASKGRYVCLINSDIIFRNNCLDSMYEYINLHSTIGIIGPKLLWPDLKMQLSCRHFPTLRNNFCMAAGLSRLFPRSHFFSGEHMSYFSHNETRQVDALTGAFLMIRKEAIDQVGMLDESFFFYCEEIDLCKRIREVGWEIVFFPHAEVIHYIRGSSSKEPVRFRKQFVLSNYKYWQKHHSSFARFLFISIFLFSYSSRLLSCLIMYPFVSHEKAVVFKGKIQANVEILFMLFKMLYKSLL